MSASIVKVWWDGKDTSGEDYLLTATKKMVKRGYMLNVPTLIQYPDGKVENGNQVKITPKGLEFLKREFPLELRNTEGIA